MLHESPPARHSRVADRLGITASTICVVHCVFAPIFFGVLPLLGVRAELHSAIEIIMLSSAAGLAIYSAALGYSRFQTWRVPVAFALAITLVVGGHFLDAFHVGRVMMLAGGFALVVLHSVSIRCR